MRNLPESILEKKLNIAVIGLGIGEAHLEGFKAHPHCQVYGLCDIDPVKLTAVSKKYPEAKTSENAKDFLEDPNVHVISIASYDQFHAEQIISALKNGKHVFAEKPLCMSAKELKDIFETAQRYPHLKMSSNLILRQSERFADLKSKIAKDQLGKLFFIEGDYNYGRVHKITEGWRPKEPFYSAILGGGIHLIDLMTWFAEERVVEVFGYGNKIVTEKSEFRFNDFQVALMKFESGAVAKISANLGCVHPHFHRFSVYGSKGTFFNEREHGIFYDSRDEKAEPKKISTSYPGVKKWDLIANFIDNILKGTHLIVDKSDIFDVMSICFAIEKSIESGQPEKVSHFQI